MELTERQRHELEYHREHAQKHASILTKPFSWGVLDNPGRRWWNAYWRMFHHLGCLSLTGKRVLVVGCGFGDDALRLSAMGARVTAFDISPESLEIARRLAARECLPVAYNEMAAERLSYPTGSFDVILARDILHHVDIPATMAELIRVAKPGATFVINEVYSHSWTERIRRAGWVQRFVYPLVQRSIYGKDQPYITEDERKLTEADVALITRNLTVQRAEHFNFLVTRIVPDRYDWMLKADRLALRVMGRLARYLSGRVLLVAKWP